MAGLLTNGAGCAIIPVPYFCNGFGGGGNAGDAPDPVNRAAGGGPRQRKEAGKAGPEHPGGHAEPPAPAVRGPAGVLRPEGRAPGAALLCVPYHRRDAPGERCAPGAVPGESAGGGRHKVGKHHLFQPGLYPGSDSRRGELCVFRRSGAPREFVFHDQPGV